MTDVEVQATVCRNGPLLVRGASEVPDGAGGVVAVNRRTVALCRCDSSSIRPWCDGSHKLVAPFDDAETDTRDGRDVGEGVR